MNKKNLTRVAGLSAAAMLALSGMAMAETTESALVKGGALNLRETASLDAKRRWIRGRSRAARSRICSWAGFLRITT